MSNWSSNQSAQYKISNNTTAKFIYLKQRTLQRKSSKYSYNQIDGSENEDPKINITYFFANKMCMVWCSKMLRKFNQKYDKTLKFNTRNTHQYQLVHISKHFWVAATCNSQWWHGTCNVFMAVMVYITCYCLSPFQHLQLHTSTWIRITCDITKGVHCRSSFECL